MEGQRAPQKKEGEHIAGVEIEAVILDYMDNGYYMDPHPWHKEKPIAQAIGVRKFTILDGIPLGHKLESLDVVTLARETVKTINEPLDPTGKKFKTFDVSLACIPGADKKIYCTTIFPVSQRISDLIDISLSDPNSGLVYLKNPSDLSKVAKERGLSEKILAVPRTPISYKDLSEIAKRTLPEAIKLIIRKNEKLFVEFFNIAEPINIRLHSIELLEASERKRLKRFLKLDKLKKLLALMKSKKY
jgi:Predicted RNA-binding protein